jgi:hypothetical protein
MVGLAGWQLSGPSGPAPLAAQSSERNRPLAVLEPATPVAFPSVVDSNSPAFWRFVRGVPQLAILNSAPHPVLSVGPDIDELVAEREVVFTSIQDGSRWIEAVIPDYPTRVYGYYHNEPSEVCDGARTMPKIGAARSMDGGRTWSDLGIIIEATGTPDCGTRNHYFSGGVGDFSAIRDRSGVYVYFLFSSYGPGRSEQGVSIARMSWANRDRPQGEVAIWSDGTWRYPEPTEGGWVYPAPTPIFPAAGSWHRPRTNVDAFWGPSVHWNTFVGKYVMLLSRAIDPAWKQDGIYLSATATIEEPASWSVPIQLLQGGSWYPQVVGLETGTGTDRFAGERARLFVGGRSDYEIVFRSPEGSAQPR